MNGIGDRVGYARPLLLCTSREVVSTSSSRAGVKLPEMTVEEKQENHSKNTYLRGKSSELLRHHSSGTPAAKDEVERRDPAATLAGESAPSLARVQSWWVANPSSKQSMLSPEWDTTSLMAFHGAKASRRQSAAAAGPVGVSDVKYVRYRE